MADRNSNEPKISAWLAVCFLVAIPVVYLIGNDVYAGIGIAIAAGAAWIGNILKVLFAWLSVPMQQSPNSLGSFLFALFIALPVIILTGIVLVVVGGPIWLIFRLLQWLIAGSEGPIHTAVHLVFDAGLVLVFGPLFYGVVFPLLWLATAPLIAHTVGEISFQRIRHRVYGDRPRFAQPMYMLVAVVSLGIGGLRLLAPVAEQGSAAWHAEVQQVYFPPTPTPPEWPKVFDVAPGQITFTYVALGVQEEVDYDSTGGVTAIVAGTITPSFKPRGDTTRSVGSTRPASQLSFQTGANGARVTIKGPPHPAARRWLATGELYTANTPWFDKGDWIQPCTGPGLQYRLRSSHGPTHWQPLNNWGNCTDPNPQGHLAAETAGRFEVRSTSPSWIEDVTVFREPQYVWLVPNPDTGIAFRRGDRFRVVATGSELTLLNDGTKIPAYATRDLTATWNGTLKLRPTNSFYNRAELTILGRGPEWK